MQLCHKTMDGRPYLPLIVLALAVAPASANAPAKLSPVLPEVNRHLQEGLADVTTSTPMARAHAQLILLDNEVDYAVLFQGVAANEQKRCLECLHSAMREWEHELDGTIKFVEIPATPASEIIVRFRPTVNMDKEPVAGYVNWSRTLSRAADGAVKSDFKADLQIRSRDLEGKAMPKDAMRHAAMHELGHVLGLDDSPREGDVMGPLDIDHPVSAPSPLEVNTVKDLRSRANEILDKAASQPWTSVSLMAPRQ